MATERSAPGEVSLSIPDHRVRDNASCGSRAEGIDFASGRRLLTLMPLGLVLALSVTAFVGFALSVRRSTRLAGIVLALLAAHYALYDGQLRGCFDEACDRFDYLFPLLLAHIAVLIVCVTHSVRRH